MNNTDILIENLKNTIRVQKILIETLTLDLDFNRKEVEAQLKARKEFLDSIKEDVNKLAKGFN